MNWPRLNHSRHLRLRSSSKKRYTLSNCANDREEKRYHHRTIKALRVVNNCHKNLAKRAIHNDKALNKPPEALRRAETNIDMGGCPRDQANAYSSDKTINTKRGGNLSQHTASGLGCILNFNGET